MRLNVHFAGVNFLDLHQVSGNYPMPVPFVPGSEGAGVVSAVGEGVTSLKPGDRVAFAMQFDGAYSSEAVVDERRVAVVPDDVPLQDAAAVMLQGITALALVNWEARIAPGDRVVVQSAAGGTGSTICQTALAAGAEVIGLTSSAEKARRIVEAGIVTRALLNEDWASPPWEEASAAEGPHVIFSAVGGDSVVRDVKRLGRRGRLIVYGQTTGQIPPLDLSLLSKKAASVTYARISAYLPEPDAFARLSDGVFRMLATGQLRPLHITLLDLADAAQAHDLVRDRSHVGKVVLQTGAAG